MLSVMCAAPNPFLNLATLKNVRERQKSLWPLSIAFRSSHLRPRVPNNHLRPSAFLFFCFHLLDIVVTQTFFVSSKDDVQEKVDESKEILTVDIADTEAKVNNLQEQLKALRSSLYAKFGNVSDPKTSPTSSDPKIFQTTRQIRFYCVCISSFLLPLLVLSLTSAFILRYVFPPHHRSCFTLATDD